MAISPIAPPQKNGIDDHATRRIFNKPRMAALVVLLALFALSIVMSWTTRGSMALLPFIKNGQRSANRSTGTDKAIVDLRPWRTAQALAALAVTAEETEYAHQAEHLADHEVDQAFATALRQANLKARNLTYKGEALALSQKVEQLKQLVAQDKAQVDVFTADLAAHAKTGAPTDVDDDDLDVVKAQLGLDSDRLDDAQDDLNRASGDDRSRIQGELAAHEEAMKKYDGQAKNGGEVAVISARRYGSLARRITAWFNQRTRYQLIMQALQQTQNDIRSITSEHDALEAHVTAAASSSAPPVDRAARLALLKDQSAERQLLSIFDDRIQTEQQLAANYGKWSAQVLKQHNSVGHLILQSLSVIVFILLCMLLGDALVLRLMAIPALHRRQMHTLRNILELTIQIIGVLLILLVIFGSPQQMPTILGLATAGITIVLQDFILAFFGWFALMGKHGVRVGDRVEINGVGGEVIEIGLLNTVLLETGNMADKGLPTGRRISFLNGYAIRGQYFNFSTTGQWMWDEIMVSLPTQADPRTTVDRIQTAVQDETKDGARIAAEEWKRTGHSDELGRLNTEPVVTLLPSGSGFNIQVRYVTRASTRSDTRTAIYGRMFELLSDRGSSTSAEQKPGTATA
jgi:small-conductance mechanosensitive channel